MRDLFQLFIRNGGFITFFLLECVCLYLIVSFNKQQKSIWLHSAGTWSGSVEKRRNSFYQYLNLTEENDRLAAENARLKQELENTRTLTLDWRDTVKTVLVDSIRPKKEVLQYSFFPARVLNNSVSSLNNYLTIDKGSRDGVRRGMGVLTGDGVAGIVREVSEQYSLVISLLHSQSKLSASLKKTGHFGSLIWDGKDPIRATLNDIPKHVEFAPGDTIVTSGFSEIFPKNLPVGLVESSRIEPGSNFFTIAVRLTTDLSRVRRVYVVDNIFQSRIDSLQQRATNEQ